MRGTDKQIHNFAKRIQWEYRFEKLNWPENSGVKEGFSEMMSFNLILQGELVQVEKLRRAF